MSSQQRSAQLTALPLRLLRLSGYATYGSLTSARRCSSVATNRLLVALHLLHKLALDELGRLHHGLALAEELHEEGGVLRDELDLYGTRGGRRERRARTETLW